MPRGDFLVSRVSEDGEQLLFGVKNGNVSRSKNKDKKIDCFRSKKHKLGKIYKFADFLFDYACC